MSETQRRRILQHLLTRGSCTAGELVYEYGIGSPRKRLSEIRKAPELAAMGYELRTERMEGHNRFGEPVTYNRYFLRRRDDE